MTGAIFLLKFVSVEVVITLLPSNIRNGGRENDRKIGREKNLLGEKEKKKTEWQKIRKKFERGKKEFERTK